MVLVGQAAELDDGTCLAILPDVSQVMQNVNPEEQVGLEADTVISTLAIPYDDFFVMGTQPSTESPAKLVVAFFNNNALTAMLYAPTLTDYNVLSTLQFLPSSFDHEWDAISGERIWISRGRIQ